MNFEKYLLFGFEGEHDKIVATDTYYAVFYPGIYGFNTPRFRHKPFTGWDACWSGTVPEVINCVRAWGACSEVLDFVAGIEDHPGSLGLLWKTPEGHRPTALYLNDELQPVFYAHPVPGIHWAKTYEEFTAYVDENIAILTLVSFDYHLGGPKSGGDAILYLEEKVREMMSTTPGYTPPNVVINSLLGWGCRELSEPANRILAIREQLLEWRSSQET